MQLSHRQTGPQLIFVCIGLLLGAALSLITPPFQAPDEQTHFFRAYQISDGHLVGLKQGEESGGRLPVSLETVAERFLHLRFHPTRKTTVGAILDARSIPLERSKREFLEFGNTVLRSPVAYLPQALGIAIGKACDLTPLMLMYLGRAANLAASLLLILLAIRLIPVFKSVLVLLALMPMSAFLMGSLSPDAFTNSIAFLFIAMILRASLLEASLSSKDLAALILASLLLSLSKQSYFPLSFLYLAIPVHRVGTARRYVFAFGLMILSHVVVLGGWALITRDLYVPASWKSNIDPVAQLWSIVERPVWFVGMLLSRLWSGAKLYLDLSVGLRLGWLDTAVPHWMVGTYQIALVATALVDSRGDVRMGSRFKLTCLVVALGNVVALGTLAYLYWTPVGSSGIGFLQGRYFIPLSPLLLTPFYNRIAGATLRGRVPWRLPIGSWQSVLLVGFLLFSSSLTLVFVAARYYW